MIRRVYLDHSATTPVDRRVVEAMLPFLTEKFGNASSIHFFGQEARAAVDKARHEVAALIKARPKEIVFTSGGTEANNLAIQGLCEMNEPHGKHIITSQIEHSAVTEVCDAMEKRGWEVTRLPVYEDGIIRIEDLKNAIRSDTILITVMAANNEIGTLQPIAEIGKIVKNERANGNKIWFHTDAVQAVGKIEINVEEIGCDLLSMSAHKLHAPKGVGAHYARRGVRLQKQNFGGHQEREQRAGTESVPHIVAFGEAARLARENLNENFEHLKNLRDRFESGIETKISDIVFNGNREQRLPYISNISFRFIEGEGLLINLDLQGIAVSTGSACSSGSLEPSPVVRALGRTDELARGAIRFSFGKDNSQEDVDYVLEVLPRAVENLRKMSPLYQQRLADTACSV
ncbi:MAG TPA: cysteine desulfurase family protein [Pyrinomonadaceae bacterium]|nr:cysteine desulfurase family protein [Pyrinomonadaceae bacterium]